MTHPHNSSFPPISALIRIEATLENTSSDSTPNAKPKPSSEVTPNPPPPVWSSKWISVSTYPYRHPEDPPNTYPRIWDVVSRTTRPKNSTADAVAILAVLRLADDEPRLLLVRQFRPPLRAVAVELPAGLIDEGESFEVAALRELREETGYEGVVKKVHRAACLSPGLSDEAICLVEVDIVGGCKGQQLDDGERVEVVSVPLERLEEALTFMEQEGCVVMHAVSSLAVGLRLSSLSGK